MKCARLYSGGSYKCLKGFPSETNQINFEAKKGIQYNKFICLTPAPHEFMLQLVPCQKQRDLSSVFAHSRVFARKMFRFIVSLHDRKGIINFPDAF